MRFLSLYRNNKTLSDNIKGLFKVIDALTGLIGGFGDLLQKQNTF